MQKVLVENNADGTTLITINRPERRNAICAETALLLQKAFWDFERSARRRPRWSPAPATTRFRPAPIPAIFRSCGAAFRPSASRQPSRLFRGRRLVRRRRAGSLDDVRSDGCCGERQVLLSRSATGLYRRPDRGTGGAHSTQGCDGELLLCRILDPQRAFNVGLVNEVVPTGQQVGVALKMAREMTEFSPLVLRH